MRDEYIQIWSRVAFTSSIIILRRWMPPRAGWCSGHLGPETITHKHGARSLSLLRNLGPPASFQPLHTLNISKGVLTNVADINTVWLLVFWMVRSSSSQDGFEDATLVLILSCGVWRWAPSRRPEQRSPGDPVVSVELMPATAEEKKIVIVSRDPAVIWLQVPLFFNRL